MTAIYGIEPDYLVGLHRPFIQSKRWVKADPRGKRRRPATYPRRRNTPVYAVGYPELRPRGPRPPVYMICIADVPGGYEDAIKFMDRKLAEFKLAAEYYHKLKELK